MSKAGEIADMVRNSEKTFGSLDVSTDREYMNDRP